MTRLEAIYALLPREGTGIVDVGTDHGRLPAKLACSGYPGNILATDINPGPLRAAEAWAEAQGCQDRIRFLLCDGLALCPPEAVDCILIAGMGGDTICGILDRAEWLFDRPYRLVLQPMTRQEVLRYWLVHNEFCIDREVLVREDGRLYQLFSASHGKSPRYSDAEYLLGSLSAEREGEPLPALLEQQTKRLRTKLHGMEQGNTAQSDTRRFYEAILNEMEQML